MRARSINEKLKEFDKRLKVEVEFDKMRSNLRSNVFPIMSDDEVHDFMVRLKGWANQMLGETDRREEPLPKHFGPRGDMDSKAWGDERGDWRDNGEMGG